MWNLLLHNHPLATGEVTDRVYAVRCDMVNFFISRSGSDVICFDSGYSAASARKGLKALNIDPGSVTHLFLTHADVDHAGGISAFPRAALYLGDAEEAMVRHQKPRMFGCIYCPRIRRPYVLLGNGDVVSAGPVRVQAIATPGHTPGSMCYLVDGDTLFAGDTFKLEGGKVCALRDRINMDTQQQKQSIRRLAQLKGVALAFTAHSGFTEDFDTAINTGKLN